MAKHNVAVGGFVANDKNEILLVKSPLRGWEFPGGVVESGETLPQALIREVIEESGAKVKVIGLIGIYKNIEKDIVNIDFYCRYESGVLSTSDESLEVGWFSIKQATGMITYPLYVERFSNMIAHNDKIYCCAFKKDPFITTESIELHVGL